MSIPFVIAMINAPNTSSSSSLALSHLTCYFFLVLFNFGDDYGLPWTATHGWMVVFFNVIAKESKSKDKQRLERKAVSRLRYVRSAR